MVSSARRARNKVMVLTNAQGEPTPMDVVTPTNPSSITIT